MGTIASRFRNRLMKEEGTMGETETIKLICFVTGDKTEFFVSIANTANVHQLAEEIYERRRNIFFGNISAGGLILHKVDIVIGSLQSANQGDLSAAKWERYPGHILADPSQPVSELWGNQRPTLGHINVLVELPPDIARDTSRARSFRCLLVDYTGKELGQPFLVLKNDGDLVIDLATTIYERNQELLHRVPLSRIIFWKPRSFNASPWDTIFTRVKVLLNTPEDQRIGMQLDMRTRLGVAFPPDQPLPSEDIHVIAQLPLDALRPRTIIHPPYEEEITFSIPSKKGFPDLKKSDISADEVEEVSSTREVPLFLQNFRKALVRKRVVPLNSSLATDLDLFSQHAFSFSDYFQLQQQNFPVTQHENVTRSEASQYMRLLDGKGILRVDRFGTQKEGQINALFLHCLAEEFERRVGYNRAGFGTSWPFSLLAVPQEGEPIQLRYTPHNDFCLQIENFPYLILEVVSSKKSGLENKEDLWRMILQASCLARLGNKLRSNTRDPVIIMAIYIDSELQAHEYLLYQPDVGQRKVLYHETVFSLPRPTDAFEFTFRLYNFLARANVESLNLQGSVAKLDQIRNGIPNSQPTLTSGLKRKHDADDDDDDAGAARPRPASDHLGDRSVQESLEAAGYEYDLTPTDAMLVPITELKPTMRDAISSDGLHVVLKLVEDGTEELAILEHLNKIKSAANHTIELHGIVDTTVTKVIALRWMTPLDDYLSFHDLPESAASFPGQLLEGVAFLHEHSVAHLDLKPGNIVIDCVDHDPPRLVIIDFGLSIFVKDEHTTIEGFHGTPPWVAPEVGTRDGPDMRYSAILADRWACGHMMSYLEKKLPSGGDGSRGGIQEMLRDQLMSDDPTSRPSLKKVLDAYRNGGTKWIADAEESEGMQKRARVSLADTIIRQGVLPITCS